jgi:hypothetical protein
MRRTLVLIVCLASSFASAKAMIEMPPRLTEYAANGIMFKQLVFKDRTREITYELPPQWTFRNTGGSVKLVAPTSPSTDIVIQAVALGTPQPFDEKGVAQARQHFTQDVPPTAQTVKVAEEVNTVPFKAANCEFTATYQALGESFTRRALYINLPDTQLIFRLTARKTDFEGLWRTFRSSILSWQWVEPSSTAATAEKSQTIVASARP